MAERERGARVNIQEREARIEWLKNLKVGDEVAVASAWAHVRRIGKVEAITPAGWVKVGGNYFVGGEGRGSGMMKIIPVTNEIRKSWARAEAQSILRNYNWSGESTETLLAVLEVLSTVEKKEASEG
jgi:hypothetical protein